jgi:hypothetical protein
MKNIPRARKIDLKTGKEAELGDACDAVKKGTVEANALTARNCCAPTAERRVTALKLV